MEKLRNFSQDTFYRGAFSGVVAGLLKDIIDFSLVIFKLKSTGFWNFTSGLVFRKPPGGIVEFLVSIILELIFCAFLGVIYSVLVNSVKTKHYILLGVIEGSLVFLFVNAWVLAFKITLLESPAGQIIYPLSAWILSMFYGFILALLDHQLNKD